MKAAIVSFVRRALGDQRGQVLPWVALGFVGMLGMGGLTVDVGNAYVVHAQLQNYANAGALAAAGLVYNTSTTNNATTEATCTAGVPETRTPTSHWVRCTTTVSTRLPELAGAVGELVPTEQPPANAVRVVEKTHDEDVLHEAGYFGIRRSIYQRKRPRRCRASPSHGMLPL